MAGTSGRVKVIAASDDVRSSTLSVVDIFRMDNALSGDAHYAKADFDHTGGITNLTGPLTRLPTGASPAQDYYEARINTNANEINFFRFDAGTQNFLAGTSHTWSLPDNVELETDGSGNHDVKVNGLSILTNTNNQHTGNTHGGLKLYHESSGATIVDNFECADLAIPAFMRSQAVIIG